jgi:hypothetical protein
MRSRIITLTSACVAAFAALTATGWGQVGTQYYAGTAKLGSAAMSFAVSDGRVYHFTFVNRCPGLRTGTPVPVTMRIVRGRFSYHDQQFTIAGRLLGNGTATGTERDVTGDCGSGLLTWTAHTTGRTVGPTSAQRAGILAAVGDPPAAAPCLNVRIAASNPTYGTVLFSSRRSCTRWIANGVSVYHRVRGNHWRVVFASSSYRCPVPHLPRSVQRDLGVCP